MSGLPGRILHTFGKNNPASHLNGGNIFVDKRTGFIHHHQQVYLRVGEMLTGKNAFEKGAAQCNVKTRKLKAENAHFSSAEFKNDVANKGQEITFFGCWCSPPI
jgi:hypothetical protein